MSHDCQAGPEISNINGMSPICQNTTKKTLATLNFTLVRLPHDFWSEACRLSSALLLQGGEKNDSLPAAGQTQPFNLCSAGTDRSSLPAKCCTPNAAVTLTGADLCNYNPYFLMYRWCRVKTNPAHAPSSHPVLLSPILLPSYSHKPSSTSQATSHSPPLEKSPFPLLPFPRRPTSSPGPARRWYLHTVAGPPCAPAVSFPGRLR